MWSIVVPCCLHSASLVAIRKIRLLMTVQPGPALEKLIRTSEVTRIGEQWLSSLRTEETSGTVSAQKRIDPGASARLTQFPHRSNKPPSAWNGEVLLCCDSSSALWEIQCEMAVAKDRLCEIRTCPLLKKYTYFHEYNFPSLLNFCSYILGNK